MNQLLQALDIAVVEEPLLEVGQSSLASVVVHWVGVMATFRALDTWNWPSLAGANCVNPS